jgi:pyridinium-3,5-bisthiocarboxylic acid mononucleotide nickel chelatase
MRIAYLECFAGIAGDMFLGALIDVGVPPQVLHDATAALNLGASLRMEKVDRSGISCTKVHVLDGERLADAPLDPSRPHDHKHLPEAPSQAPDQQQSLKNEAYTQQPKTQHQHKISHTHDHVDAHASSSTHPDDTHDGHSHIHGRSLTAIRALIQASPLAAAVKQTAIRTFELLGHAEARIHNVPIDDIHFHEVGAIDAIVDVVAASAGIHHLNVGAWHCSSINVGGGTVVCAHGTFPVPAPATADLLRGLPTYSAHVQQELVTPTGAALLRIVDPVFGQQPAMRVEQIGYGAGTRNSKNFPNVLRLSIGESSDAVTSQFPVANATLSHHQDSGTVTVLETALDDLSPQIIAYVAEKALADGALDVMLTPVIMKKGRPGTLLTVLCNPSDSRAMEHLILTETSTLGVRIRQDRRSCLDRSHATVSTPYGDIRIKVGSRSGEALNAAPEFEDCRTAAAKHHVAVKQVQQAAIAAYLRESHANESRRSTS